MTRIRYFFASALLCAVASAALGIDAVPADHAERMAKGLELFRQDVRPLLLDHCVNCHGGEKTKGDFDLVTREGLLHGGKEGPAIKPFDSGESWMMELLRHKDDPAMPYKKEKLPDEAIAKIAAWIDQGAPYDEPLIKGKTPPRDRSVVTNADRTWWAFQPLAKVEPPALAPNPVDSFLLDAAKAKKLAISPPADRRKLIRRVSLDLTGLPPTPEEVEGFLADSAPDAWDRLVGRLLDSPAYGERWGRHWLDVCRFAESSGFEHDYDRPFAFYYRDFVVKALNSDMPFDQFARWQLAGDEFEPGNPLAMMATGFLGAGVFPTQITANEVERTRYDALDDMLSTTGSAFLGVTVGCARCHDHKYDPIPTRDYYRMLSTFTTTVRSNIDLETDPDRYAKEKAEFDSAETQLRTELTGYDQRVLRPKFEAWLGAETIELPSATWATLEVGRIESKGGATFEKLADGSWLAKGTNAKSDIYTVTAHTDLPHLTGLKLDALTDNSLPAKGPGRAGNGNFALSRIRISAKLPGGDGPRELKIASATATHEQNQTSLSVASSLDDNPRTGWAVDGGGIGHDQSAAFSFAEPLDCEHGAELTVTLEFAVNTGHNIGRPRFSVCSGDLPKLDGETLPAGVAALLPKLRDASQRRSLTPAESETLFAWWKQREAGWRERSAKLAEHGAKAPVKTSQVMVCAEGFTPIVMHSQGAPFFNETYILKRGDVNQKQEVAQQGFLQVLMRDADEKRWQWTPPAGSKVSGRRRSLANWLTDVDHGAGMLLARVAVNRLWQHHFGRGLVATPNDFGKAGAIPSNPELLDWLAGELIRSGWRLKPIHRLMLSSAAYQAGAGDPGAVAADPENALFLRRTPHRLEAESIRDEILAVSGLLDRTLYGKGTLDENSRRRSLYFTVKRSQLLNSMVVFDAPEPLVSQGSRPTTTVAPQALLLMNSPQVREWAAAFATRVETETNHAGAADLSAVIGRAYALALGRPPSATEARQAADFVQSGETADTDKDPADAMTRSLTDLCQTLFALNEFIYVD